MTLMNSQILDRISAGLGNRTNKSRSGDFVPWMNLAQERITRAYHWSELDAVQTINVTPTGVPATDKLYTNTTNIRDIESIRLYEDAEPENARKLGYVSVRAWDKIIPAGEEYSTGTPTHYTYHKNKIELYRVPDVAYTMLIRWTLWPTPAADNSNFPDLINKDDLIIYLTLSFGFHEMNMTEEGNRNYGIYRTLLQDAIAEDISKRDTTIIPRGIRNDDIQSGPNSWEDPFDRGNY